MPSEVPFREVRKVLESHGWALARFPKSSHFIFCKEGEARHICLPVHKGRVKPGYIRKIEKDYGIRI